MKSSANVFGRIVEENLQAFASYYLRPYSPLSPCFLWVKYGGDWRLFHQENEQHRPDEELNLDGLAIRALRGGQATLLSLVLRLWARRWHPWVVLPVGRAREQPAPVEPAASGP